MVEKYLWQGLTRLLAIYDGNNALLSRYTYADDRTPTSVTTAGATYYMHYDQVGTLRTVTDAAGNVVKEATYDSFGNVLSDSRPTMSHFAFAGGLYDADTGLMRFGYRDYDANVGVWTAKDPIGFGGGTAFLYNYSLNSPIILADPYGLWTASFGLSGSVQVGPINFNGSAGIVFDDKGNFGTYYTGGLGLGAGAGLSGGCSIAVSNAHTIQDLEGPFSNTSVGGGLGLDVSVDLFGGDSSNGKVIGGGVTIGVGVGGGASTSITGTGVSSLISFTQPHTPNKCSSPCR